MKRLGRLSRGIGLLLGAGAMLACEPITYVSEIDCRQRNHCDAHEVCYQSFCVEPGEATQEILVDVAPPNNSPFVAQAERQGRLLADQLQQDITLVNPLTLRGRVTSPAGNHTGLVTFTPAPASPRLPGITSARIDIASVEEGFAVSLLPTESYSVTFVPGGNTPLPPRSYGVLTPDPTQELVLDYWDPSAMVRVAGEVRYTATATSIVENATVEGTATGSGGEVLRSSTATTGDDGKYQLVFPPGAAPPFAITVRRGDIPTVTRQLQWVTPPSGGAAGQVEVLDLGLQGTDVDFVTTVRDSGGRPVGNATLIFVGQQVGAGTYITESRTGVSGSAAIKSMPLGRYELWVIPPAASTTGVTPQPFCLAQAGAEEVTCGDGAIDVSALPRADSTTPLEVTALRKIKLQGTLTELDGTLVPNTRVSLVYATANFVREHATRTDESGEYQLLIDPGSAEVPITYQLVVEPSPNPAHPLPRLVQVVSVDDDPVQEINVALPPAALAHGVVLNPAGQPVPNVRVAFYSVNIPPGTPESPLRLGLGQTNDKGEYVFPILAPPPP